MLQLAGTYIGPAPRFGILSGIIRKSREHTEADIFYLGLLVATLQVLDGVLTAMGTHHFGTPVEGNPLLRMLMELIGVGPSLIFVKILAIAIVITLCKLSKQVSWVGISLRCVAVIYLWCAVIPWSVIIYTKVL